MTLYLIGLLTVLLYFAYAGARVTLSLFTLHLEVSAATVGIVMALPAIVPMLFAVKWGAISIAPECVVRCLRAS